MLIIDLCIFGSLHSTYYVLTVYIDRYIFLYVTKKCLYLLCVGVVLLRRSYVIQSKMLLNTLNTSLIEYNILYGEVSDV